MEKVNKIAQQLSTNIVESPKKWLILSTLVLIITTLGVTLIKANFSVKLWLHPQDQRMLDLEEHEKRFGSSETMDVIIYVDDTIFKKDIIELAQKVTEDMWNIVDVVRVESLINYNAIETEEDDIMISPFLDEEVDLSSDNLVLKKEKALSDIQILNNFTSSSTRIAYIRSFLKTYKENPPYAQIVDEVNEMISKYKRPGVKFHLSGIAKINDSLRDAGNRDMALVFPLVFIFLVVILAWFFKSFLSVVLPFSLVFLSIASTFGFEGYAGLTFNNIISAVPAVLIAIGLADAIHILISYRHNIIKLGQDNSEAAKNSLTKNFIPTVLTTITTTIGFLSLAVTEIQPIKDMGLMSAAGTCFAWFYTYFFIGPLLRKVSFKGTNEADKVSELKSFFNFSLKYRYLISFIFPIIALISVYLGTKNVINSDPIEYFDDSTEIKKTFMMLDKEFGGSRAVEFVLDSGKAEGIKDPDFMKRSEAFLKWVKEKDYVVRATSVVDIIQKMNKTLHRNDESFNRIPDTKRAIADQIFLYTLGLPEGMDLKNQVSLDNRYFRIIVLWSLKDTTTAVKKSEEFIAKAKSMNLTLYEGGQSPIYNKINKLVVDTFFKSMSLSLPMIFLILLFVFKDFWLSLLSLIPNVFPLSIAAGIMYLSGDTVELGNVIVFSVCLGIAVDDTIHFVANYKLKRNDQKPTAEALRLTLSQTGKALILTTVLLGIGFGMFILGDFVPNQKFGIYCSIILVIALLSDLIILPAILLIIDKDKNIAKEATQNFKNVES